LTAEAIWHELLMANQKEWIASIPDLKKKLDDAGVVFGGRQLCNHLRPKFLTTDEAANLTAVSEAVMSGIMAAKDRLLTDPALMAMLNLTEIEKEMVSHDPGYEHVAPCVRLDSFITDKGVQFVELNGECPAGPAFGDQLADVFFDHPLSRAFAERFEVEYVRTLPPLLDTLLSCYREYDSSNKTPTIAIVDYDFVPTVVEFQLCADYFESQGYPTIVCDPRELEYDGQTLTAKGKKIDLVYKRVLMNEFIEKYDEVKNMYLAYRDHNVCVVNPFRSKLVHKKAIFAVLTSDGRDEWLPAELAAKIDLAVPWTRNVMESKTNFEGQEIDLLDFTVKNREKFVMKPNDDYGGKGIYLGWEMTDGEWDEALKDALAGDYIVQTRLHMIPEQFPSMEKNLEEQSLFVDLDPYMYLGKMFGALARLGAGGLCNVSSGGGQVPILIVGKSR
jgi:hypothetical protein